MIILGLFATYFNINEFRQLSLIGLEYLTSFWNYIDLIPPLGIYILIVITNLEFFNMSIDETLERTVLSIISFFMWFKFLYFLRIFRSTGYLIRMIFEVIKDMKNFFIVLLLTIAAFGNSFSTIALGNVDPEQ